MYSQKGWSYSSAPSPTQLSAYRPRRFHVPRPPGFTPLPLAMALVGALAWYHFAFGGFALRGHAVDGVSGEPIAGARVWSARANTIAGPDGTFVLERVKPPDAIGIDAPGYRAQELRVFDPFQLLVPRLDPIGVEVETIDADTDQPVLAALDAPLDSITAVGDGRLRIAPVRDGQTLAVTATGYFPAQAVYTGQDVLRVALRPRLDGHVIDASTGKGVPGARVSLRDSILTTDSDGTFHVQHRPPDGTLSVLAPGYRRADVDLAQHAGLDITLQPNTVRATYLTYFAAGGDQYKQDLLNLLDTTEINAVVIDIKGDYGLLSYRSNVPLANQIGANTSPTIDDLDDLLRTLHQRGTYVIGRVVVFKDNVLARNGPRAGVDVGVKDRRSGQLWVDGENLAWVDPFQPAAWDYNTALAQEAIQRGFDEVQFDYIRFATDPSPGGSISDMQYSQPLSADNRVSALSSFLREAHAAVNAAGGYLSMDTFGYTTWWDDDGGIGQDVQALADDIDYYCPMVYPSTFNAGLPGSIPYPAVVSRPYDTVFQSLQHAQSKLLARHAVLRPWLQYFDDYPWATQTRYDAPQIEAQKQAAADAHAAGWMLWNAGSLFKRGGLAPKRQ